MSILNGLGMAIFPIADFASGQLFNVCFHSNAGSLFSNVHFSIQDRRLLSSVWHITWLHYPWTHLHLFYPRNSHQKRTNKWKAQRTLLVQMYQTCHWGLHVLDEIQASWTAQIVAGRAVHNGFLQIGWHLLYRSTIHTEKVWMDCDRLYYFS